MLGQGPRDDRVDRPWPVGRLASRATDGPRPGGELARGQGRQGVPGGEDRVVRLAGPGQVGSASGRSIVGFRSVPSAISMKSSVRRLVERLLRGQQVLGRPRFAAVDQLACLAATNSASFASRASSSLANVCVDRGARRRRRTAGGIVGSPALAKTP